MGEDVLVECLLQQLLDEVLLAGGALYVGAVAHAVAGSRVLGGAQAVKLVQALRKIESGVGVLHVGGDADFHTADGVDHILQTVEVHHDEVLDVQAGQRVDRVHRAARRGCQIVTGGVAVGENRVEHHVVLGAHRAFAGFAARRVDQGVSRNGDEIDVAAVCGDLHHHGGIRLMGAFAGVAAADGRIVGAVTGVLAEHQKLDGLACVRIDEFGFLLPLLRDDPYLAVFDGAVDIQECGGRRGSHEDQRRYQHIYNGIAHSVMHAECHAVMRRSIPPAAHVGHIGLAGNVGTGSLLVHACEPSCMGQNVLIVRHGVEKGSASVVSSHLLEKCAQHGKLPLYSTSRANMW